MDENDCPATDVTSITEPSLLTVTLFGDTTLCYEDCDQVIQANASGGNPRTSTELENGSMFYFYGWDAFEWTDPGRLPIGAPTDSSISHPRAWELDDDGDKYWVDPHVRTGVCGYNTLGEYADGVYGVTVTDDKGCIAWDTLTIRRPDSVRAYFDWLPDPEDPLSDGYYEGPLFVQFVDQSYNTRYEENIWEYWSAVEDVDSDDMIRTEVGEAEGDSITYFTFENLMPITFYAKLTVSRDGYCTISDSVSFNVRTISCLYIPDVFTPNGDGVNDYFEMIRHCNLETFVGDIYNRWGEKLYHWENPEAAWDGRTLSGEEVPDGVYFYVISARGFDGVNRADMDDESVETVAGSVTIIR